MIYAGVSDTTGHPLASRGIGRDGQCNKHIALGQRVSGITGHFANDDKDYIDTSLEVMSNSPKLVGSLPCDLKKLCSQGLIIITPAL